MELLTKGAAILGIPLSPKQIEKFRIYSEELIDWNGRFNLTAISEPDQIQLKHFLDSLSVLLIWRGGNTEPASTVIDIGSGAGLPGIPLKIICPRLRLTLVEATAKKVTFLNHMIEKLGLEHTVALQARAEELAHKVPYREKFDLVLARAVAPLAELMEYTLPFARPGGSVIAHKGPAAPQEAQDAAQAFSILGGRLERLVKVELPGVAEERQLVWVKKVARTPELYPRRSGLPHKQPLGSKADQS